MFTHSIWREKTIHEKSRPQTSQLDVKLCIDYIHKNLFDCQMSKLNGFLSHTNCSNFVHGQWQTTRNRSCLMCPRIKHLLGWIPLALNLWKPEWLQLWASFKKYLRRFFHLCGPIEAKKSGKKIVLIWISIQFPK